jgi:hypothetical protein
MRKYGRIVMCGSISNYNKESSETYGVRNLFVLTTKSLKAQGFLVADWMSEFPAATQRLVTWVAEGKLKVGSRKRRGILRKRKRVPFFALLGVTVLSSSVFLVFILSQLFFLFSFSFSSFRNAGQRNNSGGNRTGSQSICWSLRW